MFGYDHLKREVLLQRDYQMKVVDVEKVVQGNVSYDLVTIQLIEPGKLAPIPR
jgi:hypothetical protein